MLDRNINRKIKDKPVKEKVKEYKKSKYVSVRTELLEKREICQEWGIKAVERRRDKEIEKIEKFMEVMPIEDK